MKFSITILPVVLALSSASAFVTPKASRASTSLAITRTNNKTFTNSLGINGDLKDARRVNGDRNEMPATGSSSFPQTIGTYGRNNIRSRYNDLDRLSTPHESRTSALERVGNRGGGRVESVYDVWEELNKSPIAVQGGGSLRTWTFQGTDRAQVILRTEGRPLEAKVEMWAGPDHTPQEVRVYSEDGYRYPFAAAIASPFGTPSTVAIRNAAQLEFPLDAGVEEDNSISGLGALTMSVRQARFRPRTIQGDSVVTFPVDMDVGRMQVFLESDGRPLNARVELLEGPNSKKQVIDLYADDGQDRPFLTVMETPGAGSVIRIVNTGTVEFPIYAHVMPIGRKTYQQGGGSYRGGGRMNENQDWYENNYGDRRNNYSNGGGYGGYGGDVRTSGGGQSYDQSRARGYVGRSGDYYGSSYNNYNNNSNGSGRYGSGSYGSGSYGSGSYGSGSYGSGRYGSSSYGSGYDSTGGSGRYLDGNWY